MFHRVITTRPVSKGPVLSVHACRLRLLSESLHFYKLAYTRFCWSCLTEIVPIIPILISCVGWLEHSNRTKYFNCKHNHMIVKAGRTGTKVTKRFSQSPDYICITSYDSTFSTQPLMELPNFTWFCHRLPLLGAESTFRVRKVNYWGGPFLLITSCVSRFMCHSNDQSTGYLVL